MQVTCAKVSEQLCYNGAVPVQMTASVNTGTGVVNSTVTYSRFVSPAPPQCFLLPASCPSAFHAPLPHDLLPRTLGL